MLRADTADRGWSLVWAVASYSLLSWVGIDLFTMGRPNLRKWSSGFSLLWQVSLALVIIVTYSSQLYPLIPTWLGGGKPELVRIVGAQVESVCGPCAADGVRMVDDDLSRVVVVVTLADGRNQAIEIARSKIDAIVHGPVAVH